MGNKVLNRMIMRDLMKIITFERLSGVLNLPPEKAAAMVPEDLMVTGMYAGVLYTHGLFTEEDIDTYLADSFNHFLNSEKAKLLPPDAKNALPRSAKDIKALVRGAAESYKEKLVKAGIDLATLPQVQMDLGQANAILSKVAKDGN